MTPTEALTKALVLALSASTDEKSKQASVLADKIAADFGLSELEVERCKKAALKEWNAE